MGILEGRKHAGEDLEPQVFLVAQSVGAALDDPDFVVEAFDKPERDLVLGLAIGSDSVPMTVDHLSELLVGTQPLPFEGGAPVLEEAPCPALAPVAPELVEGFLEQVSGVQALVGGKQRLQCLAAFQGEILPVREQRVLLSFDEAALCSRETRVFALAHLVQRLAQVAHDVELVKEDRRLRGAAVRHLAKRLPHVHDGQPDTLTGPFAQPFVELPHTRLGAILPAEPDRTTANEVAHHDPIGMALADRDFVDADHLRPRRPGLDELHAHILFVQLLDAVPTQVQFRGDVLDRGITTAPAHVVGKTLGVQRTIGQKRQPLALHRVAASAQDPPNLELEVYPIGPAGQIAHASATVIVPARVHSSAHAARRFFERRTRVMTRAVGSPKTPWSGSSGRKPINRYASSRRFCFAEVAMNTSCQIRRPYEMPETQCWRGFPVDQTPKFTHTDS